MSLGHETVGLRRAREKRARANRFLEGKPLIVGLDLGKGKHAAVFGGLDLVPIRRFMVPHSLEGVGRLLEEAERDRVAGGFDRVIVFFEPTSHFWQNVANVLDARGIDYRTVASLGVERHREIEHLTYAKGDYRDAVLILQMGGRGQWLRRLLHADPLWLELRTLSYEHELLLELETAERLRVRSFVELVLPEFFDYFDDPLKLTARTLLKVLATGTPATFQALLESAAQVTGHRLRVSKIKALTARLATNARFGVERLLGPTLVRVGLAIDRYELLSHQRSGIRKRLVALYEKTPYRVSLETIPGVGPENHALLLGLVGDPKQYDRSTCLVKLAGAEPRENHSGMGEGSHSISRRGSSRLRHLLHRIVLGLRSHNKEFSAYLARLQKRDASPLKFHQAAVATGNKYLRLVFRLCVAGARYDATKLGSR